jgi:hypothetical protein
MGSVLRVMLVAWLGWAGASPLEVRAAPAKKKEKKHAAPTVDDFLGDLDVEQGKSKPEDLDQAVRGVKRPEGAPLVDDGMAPRAALQERNAPVTLKGLFVASKIMMGHEGCVIPKNGQVRVVEAPDVPFELGGFSVCARLESNRGRAVQVTFKVVTPKGRVVGTADETIDFVGKPQVDHVVEFPPMTFPIVGKYLYRLDVEGVAVSQHHLFEVKPRLVPPPPPSPDSPPSQ